MGAEAEAEAPPEAEAEVEAPSEDPPEDPSEDPSENPPEATPCRNKFRSPSSFSSCSMERNRIAVRGSAIAKVVSTSSKSLLDHGATLHPQLNIGLRSSSA